MRTYPIIFSQVYCIQREKILLLKRTREPNLDLWVAPGGKLEPYESPYQCALRELLEESGLKSGKLYFRGMISLVFSNARAPSLQFIYLAKELTGKLKVYGNEGVLKWHPIASLSSLPMPPEISVFLPRIVDLKESFYQAKICYGQNYEVMEIEEYPTFIS